MNHIPEASPYKPANANQLATIAKLCRMLGFEDTAQEDWTSADASEEITRLAKIYNQRQSNMRKR